MSAERLATLVLVLGVVWILTRVAAGRNRKPLPPGQISHYIQLLPQD